MRPIEQVSPEIWKVPSSSRPGAHHTVRMEASGYTCDCPGFEMKGKCSHIKRLNNEQSSAGRRLNENLVVFTRNAAIATELPEEGEVDLRVTGVVQGVETKNREDGTYDRLFKIRLLTIEEPEDA